MILDDWAEQISLKGSNGVGKNEERRERAIDGLTWRTELSAYKIRIRTMSW